MSIPSPPRDYTNAMNKEVPNSLASTSKEPSPSSAHTSEAGENTSDTGEKWDWWQGYRKNRVVLGFEAPPGKNVTLLKKPQRRRKREDD
jgi:hypothetical protein